MTHDVLVINVCLNDICFVLNGIIIIVSHTIGTYIAMARRGGVVWGVVVRLLHDDGTVVVVQVMLRFCFQRKGLESIHLDSLWFAVSLLLQQQHLKVVNNNNHNHNVKMWTVRYRQDKTSF